MAARYDVVVVGAGPNGLAAAITLAQTGKSVALLEGSETVGGGMRTTQLTVPGFHHDVCSAIHPLVLASPFFRNLPLADHGLRLVHPERPLAHALDGGLSVGVERSIDETAARLGPDAKTYTKLFEPLAKSYEIIVDQFFAPLSLPAHPLVSAGFGLRALRSCKGLAGRFRTDGARGLVAGVAAHSMVRLTQIPSGAVALVLGMLAHAVGWPAAVGGSQQIANALAAHFESLGGEIILDRYVSSIDDLPPHRVGVFDTAPRHLASIAEDHLPAGYRSKLESFRYGPGVFKIDWALDGPIPWTDDVCTGAGTVHLGGTFEEIAAAEDDVSHGHHPEKPFVLLAQPSMFDAYRAPAGQHTGWAYCHVPNGSARDMTGPIEAQVERFAPGFRDRIIGRRVFGPSDLERYNPNYVGGDINGGIQDLRQLFTRPTISLDPYSTPNTAIFICSSSTPPGGGVHGLCGYFAAQSVLKKAFR